MIPIFVTVVVIPAKNGKAPHTPQPNDIINVELRDQEGQHRPRGGACNALSQGGARKEALMAQDQGAGEACESAGDGIHAEAR